MSVARPALIVVLSLAALASAQTSRPVPSTRHDRLAANLAFNRRTLGGAYAADGTPKDATDADARRFLDLMADRMANAGFDSVYKNAAYETTRDDTMLPLARALDACRNPMVSYCRALVYNDGGDEETYRTLMRDCCPKLIAGEYPAFRKYNAARVLARLTPDDASRLKPKNEQLIRMIVDAEPADRRNVLNLVLENEWNAGEQHVPRGLTSAERQAVLDAAAADPKADAWLTGVLRGEHEVKLAWDSRGFGWANTVTPEGWAGFHKHIALARDALTAAHRGEPTYPEAATRMITVCMAEDGAVDDGRVWFDRAVAGQIDYFWAWQAYASLLQPRWGGSLDAMQRLAHEAVATGRYDTLTPMAALDIYEMMTHEQDAGQAVYRRPGVWDDIDRLIDGYTRPPTHGVDVSWLRSRRAAFARVCGQYARAVREIDELADDAQADAFTPWDVTAADARTECAAKSGPRAGRFRTLALAESVNPDAARGVYAGLLAEMAAGDPDRGYTLQRERALAVSAALQAGRGVEVPAAGVDDLAAWVGAADGWTARDGVLSCSTDKPAGVLLKHRATLPPAYKLTLEWQWTADREPAVAPRLGVAVQDTKEQHLIMADFFPDPGRVGLHLNDYWTIVPNGTGDAGVELPEGRWHAVELARTAGTVTLVVNGVTLGENVQNDWFDKGDPILGLFVKPFDGKSTVRVRKLTVTPVSP